MTNSSVRYRIIHQTAYGYSEPVAICRNQLRMQAVDRSGVNCHFTTVEISPIPESVSEHVDYFGNRVYCFAIESSHRELLVRVESDVTVNRAASVQSVTTPWNEIRDLPFQQLDQSNQHPHLSEFLFDSPRIRRSAVFRDYARPMFSPGRSVTDATMELTQRICSDFRYDPKATNVSTSPENAFRMKAGVCQDFAQIQIACLRSLGLPARYVSGYLRTVPSEGKERLTGADESHAWLSVYCGQDIGWVEFDPTNATLATTDHIPICIGRDYSDVAPMRGVVVGGGKTNLKVNVDVIPSTS